MPKIREYNAYDMLAYDAPSYCTFFSHQDKKLYWKLHDKATKTLRGDKEFKDYLMEHKADRRDTSWSGFMDKSLVLKSSFSQLGSKIRDDASIHAFNEYRLDVSFYAILSQFMALFIGLMGFMTNNPDVAIVLFIASPLLLAASAMMQHVKRNTFLTKLDGLEQEELIASQKEAFKVQEQERIKKADTIDNVEVEEEPDEGEDPDGSTCSL